MKMAIPTKVRIRSLKVPVTLRAIGPQTMTMRSTFIVMMNPKDPEIRSKAISPICGSEAVNTP